MSRLNRGFDIDSLCSGKGRLSNWNRSKEIYSIREEPTVEIKFSEENRKSIKEGIAGKYKKVASSSEGSILQNDP